MPIFVTMTSGCSNRDPQLLHCVTTQGTQAARLMNIHEVGGDTAPREKKGSRPPENALCCAGSVDIQRFVLIDMIWLSCICVYKVTKKLFRVFYSCLIHLCCACYNVEGAGCKLNAILLLQCTVYLQFCKLKSKKV